MIRSNQIIERVEQTQKFVFKNEDITTMTNSIMKVRVPSNQTNDKFFALFNQVAPTVLEQEKKTLWSILYQINDVYQNMLILKT